ncbi:uncharacterized [Tachysurus ichikawai]
MILIGQRNCETDNEVKISLPALTYPETLVLPWNLHLRTLRNQKLLLGNRDSWLDLPRSFLRDLHLTKNPY